MFSRYLDICTIVNAIPQKNCYVVSSPYNNTHRYAQILSHFYGNGSKGATELTSYPVGTAVLVFFISEAAREGFILGKIEKQYLPQEDTFIVPDWISVNSNTGILDDIYKNTLTKDSLSMKVIEHGNMRPSDLLQDDWGAITEFGSYFLLDKFTAAMRASDVCGMWAFLFDNLLRIYGYNYEHFTSATEHRVMNDLGEVHNVLFEAKYPYESLGYKNNGTDITEKSEKIWQKNKYVDINGSENEVTRKYDLLKLKEAKQTGIWRGVSFRGMLGDLYHDYVAAPPSDLEEPETLEKETKYNGLSEIVRSADGFVGIRSAKAISFVKYPVIPVPKQKALPDDDVNGDKELTPKVKNDYTFPEKEVDTRAVASMEFNNYRFNWHALQNIINHEKDWYVPEESDLNRKGYTKVAMSDFLASLPALANIPIGSEDYSSVKHYASYSAITQHDDGSIVLEDGWGSQISMSRGNITITCAGDLQLRPGRNCVIMSPQDTIIKGGRNVDLSATKHDIRLKAENNLQVVSNTGGLLLESKADSEGNLYKNKEGEDVVSSGVLVKSKKSNIALWGKNVHVNAVEGEEGRIVIDANKGETKEVYIKAKYVINDVKEAVIDRFNDGENVHYWHKEVSIVDCPNLVVNGSGWFIDGHVGADKSMFCNKGFATGKGAPYVAPLDQDAIPDTFNDAVEQAKNMTNEYVEKIKEQVYDNENGLGNTDFIKSISFTFRNTEQYRTQSFAMAEARWQHVITGGGNWKEVYVEPEIGGPTYPYPGEEAQTSKGYYVYEEQNFSTDDGRSKNRDEITSEAIPLTEKGMDEYKASISIS